MPTKDSSCLQGKEGNASVDSYHTVHGGLVQHWNRLRGSQPDCKWSVHLLLRIIWKSHMTAKAFVRACLLERLNRCFGWPNQ